MGRKTPWSHKVVCFQMLDFVSSNPKSEVSKTNLWKTTHFLKTMSLQREPFLINVSCYQQLPITRYQVRFYADPNQGFAWFRHFLLTPTTD